MKRSLLLSLLLLAALLLAGCAANEPAPTTAPTPIAAPTATAAAAPTATAAPTPTVKPVSPEVQAMQERNEQVWKEMHQREWMEGRLVIPSAGIDVALFSWGQDPVGEYDTDKIVEIVRQDVVDHEDSALLYYDDRIGTIIADHSNQDFSALSSIQVGDAAYILQGDRLVSLKCSFVGDGVNTGYGITDPDGGWNHADTDYVCYTCLEDWTHIRLVGFSVTDEDFFQPSWIDVAEPQDNRGVAVSTSVISAPASTAEPAADTTGGTAGAAATPAPTAEPTAAPAQAAQPAPAQQQPVYNDDVPPGPDIYADDYNASFYNYNSSNPSGDGYLN